MIRPARRRCGRRSMWRIVRGALPAPPPSVPAPLGEPLARRRCRDAGVAAAVPSVLRVAHSRRAAAHLARRPAAGPLARPASAKASCGGEPSRACPLCSCGAPSPGFVSFALARRPLVAPARQLGGALRRFTGHARESRDSPLTGPYAPQELDGDAALPVLRESRGGPASKRRTVGGASAAADSVMYVGNSVVQRPLSIYHVSQGDEPLFGNARPRRSAYADGCGLLRS